MPGFKNLPVKALNKGQPRIVPAWLSRKALPHPTLHGAHLCPSRCHSEMWWSSLKEEGGIYNVFTLNNMHMDLHGDFTEYNLAIPERACVSL